MPFNVKFLLLIFLFILQVTYTQSQVKLRSGIDEVHLSNEFVQLTINRKTATITSLKYHGLEMMGKPHNHWNIVGTQDEDVLKKFPQKMRYSVRMDPAKNQGERAEISFLYSYQPGEDAIPFDIDLRFSLGRRDQGIYLSALWKHRKGHPKFNLGQGRMIALFNPQVFDFYTVDANRRQVMASGADVKRGRRMNVKEAVLLTTGVRKGEVEHKYDYSAILAQTPAWGWTSTKYKVGCWMINPSFEYINGGPTQVGNTGHVEAILLNHWHDSHYGGAPLLFKQDEEWEKFAGPFYIYFNSGGNHEQLWKDALAQADQQRKMWPFPWVKDKAYAAKEERGMVTGRIELKDPALYGTKASNMWVGLAATGGAKDADWQYEGKSYQFWAKADEHGNFQIPNVRQGKYDLYAFGDGVLGEYKKAGISISEGERLELGKLQFIPPRFGKQLWEIGIPDRSAAEFKHGDHYWKWGLYMLYPKEFPNDVNYTIGSSDWSRDWNYCQPGVIAENFDVMRGTTWRINFEVPEPLNGKATLRLAFCGSRRNEVIRVALNDKEIGSAGPLPSMGVMHRDGIRGKQAEVDISFDAKQLKKGMNTISLSLNPRNWTYGVLYDYLRLEVEE